MGLLVIIRLNKVLDNVKISPKYFATPRIKPWITGGESRLSSTAQCNPHQNSFLSRETRNWTKFKKSFSQEF